MTFRDLLERLSLLSKEARENRRAIGTTINELRSRLAELEREVEGRRGQDVGAAEEGKGITIVMFGKGLEEGDERS